MPDSDIDFGMVSAAELQSANQYIERLEAKHTRLLDACKRFVNANRSEHLIVRLNDEEMAAVNDIKKEIAAATGSDERGA